MNGADNDPQWDAQRGTFIDDGDHLNPIPMKQEHPDWLIDVPFVRNGLWNYQVQDVRDYYLRNLREVADNLFSGIPFSGHRAPFLPSIS